MMDSDTTTLKTVGEVITDVFGLPPESVNATTVQEDLPEWDSLGHLNLVLALEETFGISFSVEEMPSLTSVGAIVTLVDEKCRLT
jgi:acyl carrier protein